MIGNILHTFGSRIFIAILSFLMLLLNANYLGAEGLGTVGLLILNITILILISNLVCGSIIYYSSRLNTANLTINAYLWILISLLLFFGINRIYPLVEKSLEMHFYFLAFIQASMSVHLFLLLGWEKIKQYNFLSLLQSITTILTLLVFYLFIKDRSIFAFIYSLYIAYSIVWLLGVILTIPHLPKPKLNELIPSFRKSFSYGFYAQAANTFQLLNYRISYFFLDAISGRAALGIYTAGVQLSEALLLPGKSISTVQYSRISRRKNENYARRITILFMKVSFLLTAMGTILLIAIPADFFSFLLGKDFSQIKPVLWGMSFGIVALSAEVILSHYFSGTGQQKMNSLSAFIGFAITIVGCFTLIPAYGALGAAISTSASYSGMFIFLFILMIKDKKSKPIEFLPSKRDLQLFKHFVRKFTKK